MSGGRCSEHTQCCFARVTYCWNDLDRVKPAYTPAQLCKARVFTVGNTIPAGEHSSRVSHSVVFAKAVGAQPAHAHVHCASAVVGARYNGACITLCWRDTQ